MVINIELIKGVLLGSLFWIAVAVMVLFAHWLWRKIRRPRVRVKPQAPAPQPVPEPKYQDYCEPAECWPVILYPDGKVMHTRADTEFYYEADVEMEKTIESVRFYKSKGSPVLHIETYGMTFDLVYHPKEKFWRWWFPGEFSEKENLLTPEVEEQNSVDKVQEPESAS